VFPPPNPCNLLIFRAANPYKQEVAGSSPALPTKSNLINRLQRFLQSNAWRKTHALEGIVQQRFEQFIKERSVLANVSVALGLA
jgi:hypothetical protein